MFDYSKTDRVLPPRRVLQLASGDLWAGAEVQLFHLAGYLQQRDEVELLVVLLNPGELQQRLMAAGIAVIVIDESSHGFFRLLWLLMAIVRDFRPNIIHTHRQKENLLGSLAAMLLPRCSSLRTVHGADEHMPARGQWLKRVRKAVDQLAGRWLQTHVVCVSAALKEALADRYAAHQLVVIANGIDVAAVQALAAGPVPGLPDDRIKVAFIGRMVPVKRIDLFVEIARLVGQQCPNQYQFYAIGDGPLLETARQQATEYGLDNLTFTGFRADSPQWLAAMDRLCMVSDHEGLPMVLLEAMALRVPIIARRVGGIAATLDNGAAGHLVDSAAPQAFADVLVSFADDAAVPEGYLAKAWQRVNQHFSARVMADRYLAIYLNG